MSKISSINQNEQKKVYLTLLELSSRMTRFPLPKYKHNWYNDGNEGAFV